ncbi:MAG TPA: ATP-binding protein, partial [Gemmataceae bacterium]|nr:ATP-binding protein [Gemmataceae bacterium]
VGGLICGYSITRNLSRTIARLRVCVQDVHSQVAPEVDIVDLRLGHGLGGLQEQMQFLVQRVQGLVERLQAQQRDILRAEQLAMVGRLATSVAHEIRNPLTAMKWLVTTAVRGYPHEPLRMEDLRVLQNEIERMEQTVQGMLDFVRPTPPCRQECDLRDLVRQAIELIRARRRQLGVTCQLELPTQPVVASVDPAQVKSVLVNLLLNALDAMPRGGRLSVRLGQDPAQGTVLAVEDSGGGLAPDVLDRLFQPFTTTKPTGTGLGLSVAKRFVEENGGRLHGENRKEGGARFVVTLPPTPQRNGKPHAEATSADH